MITAKANIVSFKIQIKAPLHQNKNTITLKAIKILCFKLELGTRKELILQLNRTLLRRSGFCNFFRKTLSLKDFMKRMLTIILQNAISLTILHLKLDSFKYKAKYLA